MSRLSRCNVKCSRCDCETAETVLPHPDSLSVYCRGCGLCSRCGGSVEDFKYCADLDAWLCPCVIERREQPERPRPEYKPIPVVIEEKKPRTKRDHWQRSA